MDLERPILLIRILRYHRGKANAALEAFNKGDYDKVSTISHNLLLNPKLPRILRAQSNLLLASMGGNTAVAYAEAAVRWYDRALERKPEDQNGYLKKMRGEAELIIKAARGTEPDSKDAGDGSKQGVVDAELGEPVEGKRKPAGGNEFSGSEYIVAGRQTEINQVCISAASNVTEVLNLAEQFLRRAIKHTEFEAVNKDLLAENANVNRSS